MTKSTVQHPNDKDSLTRAEVAAHDAFPEVFKAADPILIQPKKPLSLETAGSELYAAIMNGEVQNVRAQLQHGDKMTEAEATMLIRVRDKAREKGAHRREAEECITAKRKSKKKGDNSFAEFIEELKVRQTKRLKPLTAYSGPSVVDVYGGRYTPAGYEAADGSYLGTGGEFYNATNRILTLADGKAFKLAEDLPTSMADIINTAHKVRSVRQTTAAELDFVPAAEGAAPAISPAMIEVVADAAALAAKETDTRAAAAMEREAFKREGDKAPAGAIEQLDGTPGLSAEDIHIAIQIHRRAMRENRRVDMLNEADCRDILEVREGLACVDTSSMKRCRMRSDDDSISVSFNQPAVIVAVGEVGRSLKACFRKASNDKPKAATPVHTLVA